MIKSKWIVVLAPVLVLALILTLFFLEGTGEKTTPAYQSGLFDKELVNIDISVDEEKWQEMIQNAKAEEFIPCDLTVDGVKLSSVGIRPKGNSSLTQVAGTGSSRFSFRISFDEYIDGQNYLGLDQMVLNNAHSDYTFMKDYICYDLMEYMGVNAPLTTYVNLTLNGEQFGVYLAVEFYGDAYKERVSGDISGNIYSIKNVMGGRESSGGGDLVYNGEEESAYTAIFENAIGKTNSAAKNRMISAIEALNTGEDLEKYWDVDKALRYLAVHTFVVNLDSYSGNMKQNYALFEKDGVVQVLPWDYNLAFGGFQGGDASSSINFPIDTPVSGATMEERPLINTLLSNEEYRAKYHEYLNKICTEYVQGGVLKARVAGVKTQIDNLVESDPTKFCTYEQYEAADDALLEFCNLRAASVTAQIAGVIPSTTEGQKGAENLIEADREVVSAMGNQGGGKGGFGDDRQMPQGDRGMGRGQRQNGEMTTEGREMPENDEMPTPPEGMEMQANGEMPTLPEGMEMPEMPQGGRGMGRGQRQNGEMPTEGMKKTENGEMPIPSEGFRGMESQGFDLTGYLPIIICVVIFAGGLIFALLWKRKY